MKIFPLIDPFAIHFDTFAGDVYTLDTAGITLTLGTMSAAILEAGGTDKIRLIHDGTNAVITTDDGSFLFRTDEGTNTDTFFSIDGKGTGVGKLAIGTTTFAETGGLFHALTIGDDGGTVLNRIRVNSNVAGKYYELTAGGNQNIIESFGGVNMRFVSSGGGGRMQWDLPAGTFLDLRGTGLRIGSSGTAAKHLEVVDSTDAQFRLSHTAGSVFTDFKTDSTGNLTIANSGNGTILSKGILYLNETITPTAIANHGALYTKNVNELFFQDGAGVEHLVHGDAFGDMWFHGAIDTIAISTEDTFVLIDSFVNTRDVDDLGNVTVSIANSEFTINTNGAGTYTATFHCSITSNGANSEKVVVFGRELATSLTISAATNATPIVVTFTTTGLDNGDMVTITGATGNTGANGDWILTAKSGSDFTLVDMQRANSVGNGAYDADSADITIIYPGNILMHRIVSQTDLGVGGGDSELVLAVGDKLALYVASINSTRDLEIAQISMEIRRIGD